MVVNARFWKKVSGVRYDPQEGWKGAKGVSHGGEGMSRRMVSFLGDYKTLGHYAFSVLGLYLWNMKRIDLNL